MDLPGWQALRDELHPKGLEVVTVALDTGGPEAVRSWVEAAAPEHPSLIDEAHVVDELFGIVNVPNGCWIDEGGTMVRPAEPAHLAESPTAKMLEALDPSTLPPVMAETLAEARKIRHDRGAYEAALRDWVDKGPDSRFALSPDEVLRRSQPRPPEVALAAAHFELGQHLHRSGHPDDAIAHFREAHRLQPGNWTYKRQAWSFVDPFQGPTDVYEGNWLADVKKVGAENYYPPLDL